MIVLGDKYDVTEFRDEGITQLEKLFPESVHDWDRIRIRIGGWYDWEAAGISYKRSDFIAIACVTRLLQIPRLHAGALYQCCSLPVLALLGDCEDEDDYATLSPDDLRRCLKGRETLPGVWLSMHRMAFNPLPKACTSTCSPDAMDKYVMEHTVAKIQPRVAYNPLEWETWRDLFDTAEGVLCEECITFCRRRHDKARQALLNSLEDRFKCVFMHVHVITINSDLARIFEGCRHPGYVTRA